MYKITCEEIKNDTQTDSNANNGSSEKPYLWDEVCGDDRTKISDLSKISGKTTFVKVKLNAGTQYVFFVSNDIGDSYLRIWKAGDMSAALESSDADGDDDTSRVKLYFTPTTSGDYLVEYTDYSSAMDEGGSEPCSFTNATINPAPQTIQSGTSSKPKVLYKPSEGFNVLTKRPVKYRSMEHILPNPYLPGFFYSDTNSRNSFSSFDDAASISFNNITHITKRNLNLGNDEATLFSGYTNDFTEKIWGYMYIETPGTYTFSGQSDDHGALQIKVNDTVYKSKITWSGIHNYFTVNFPESGYYPFEYYHGEGGGGQISEVYWTTPTNSNSTSLPSDIFYIMKQTPKNKPIFYAPLSFEEENAKTGQSLKENGDVIYEIIDNSPCATFNGNSFIYSDGVKNALVGMFDKISYSAWFKVNDKTQKQQTIISCTESSGFNVAISGDDYDGLSFYLYAGGSYLTGVACSVDKIKDNAWNFIAVTYDGAVCNIYLNDEKVYSANKSGWVVFSSNENIKLTIGAEANGNNELQQCFNGNIADVRVYNRALRKTEITNLYNEFTNPRIVIKDVISLSNKPNKEMSYTLNAVETSGNIVSYELVSGELPEGISFNNGVFSGTPTVESTYNFWVRCYTENLEKRIKVIMIVSLIPVGAIFFDSLESTGGWETNECYTVSDEKRNVFEVNWESGYAIKRDNPGVPLGSSSRTISFWYKSINGYTESRWCGIGYGASGSNHRYTWGLAYDNYPSATFWSNDYFQTEVGRINDTLWHQITMTYDGNTTKLYIDKQEVWTWQSGRTDTQWQFIHIGDPWEYYATYGRYADFYIYDRVLTQDEISGLYESRTV